MIWGPIGYYFKYYVSPTTHAQCRRMKGDGRLTPMRQAADASSVALMLRVKGPLSPMLLIADLNEP